MMEESRTSKRTVYMKDIAMGVFKEIIENLKFDPETGAKYVPYYRSQNGLYQEFQYSGGYY